MLNKKNSLLLVSLFIISACNSKLERSDAEYQIKEHLKLPYQDIRNFQSSEIKEIKYTVPFKYYPEYIKNQTSWGYVTYSENTDLRIVKQEEAVRNAKIGNPPRIELFTKLEQAGLIEYSIDVVHTEIQRQHYPYSELTKKGYVKYYGNLECLGNAYHNATFTSKGKEFTLSNGQVITSTIEFGEITGIIQSENGNSARVEFTLNRTNITPFGRIVFNLKEDHENRILDFIKYDDGWRIQN
jgi:hypothetical protein